MPQSTDQPIKPPINQSPTKYQRINQSSNQSTNPASDQSTNLQPIWYQPINQSTKWMKGVPTNLLACMGLEGVGNIPHVLIDKTSDEPHVQRLLPPAPRCKQPNTSKNQSTHQSHEPSCFGGVNVDVPFVAFGIIRYCIESYQIAE